MVEIQIPMILLRSSRTPHIIYYLFVESVFVLQHRKFVHLRPERLHVPGDLPSPLALALTSRAAAAAAAEMCARMWTVGLMQPVSNVIPQQAACQIKPGLYHMLPAVHYYPARSVRVKHRHTHACPLINMRVCRQQEDFYSDYSWSKEIIQLGRKILCCTHNSSGWERYISNIFQWITEVKTRWECSRTFQWQLEYLFTLFAAQSAWNCQARSKAVGVRSMTKT